jgi:hypothetical protein
MMSRVPGRREEDDADGVHRPGRLRGTDSARTNGRDAFRTDWPDTVAEARVLRSSFERNASVPDGTTVATVQIGPATLDVPRFGFVPPAAAAEGDIEAMAMYAGESAGLIDAIVPAARHRRPHRPPSRRPAPEGCGRLTPRPPPNTGPHGERTWRRDRSC